MPRTRPDEDIEVDTIDRRADAADNEPVERPEPPAPPPPGTEGADSAAREKPHRTCSDGRTVGASGKNQVE